MAEGDSVVVYLSSYRNSKVCPIHFAPLRDNGSWHTLYCPRGHVVDRDVVAVLNMLWKITPKGAAKAVWWDVKEVKKRLGKGIVPREAVRKANPIAPRPIVHVIWASLARLKASDKRPAVLARAAPMTAAAAGVAVAASLVKPVPVAGDPRDLTALWPLAAVAALSF